MEGGYAEETEMLGNTKQAQMETDETRRLQMKNAVIIACVIAFVCLAASASAVREGATDGLETDMVEDSGPTSMTDLWNSLEIDTVKVDATAGDNATTAAACDMYDKAPDGDCAKCAYGECNKFRVPNKIFDCGGGRRVRYTVRCVDDWRTRSCREAKLPCDKMVSVSLNDLC